MPTHNSSEVIESSVRSVLCQSYSELELVIVDDASTDNTMSILKSFGDSRLQIIQLTRNVGAGAARNAGLKAAKYDIIAFCDSDDIWLPEKLELQYKAMKIHNAPIVCSAYRKLHFATGKLSKPITPPKIIRYKDLLRTCSIAMSTALVDRTKVGSFYMPDMRTRQDYAMWLRITQSGHWAFGLDRVLVYYRYGGESISKNKLKAAINHWRVLRVSTNDGIIKRGFNFVIYAIVGLWKYLR